jgi:hypothetical protein
MLYGRRILETQRTHAQSGDKKYILNKAFQYKYSWYLVTAVAGATLLFLIPTYYFLVQNYQIFTSLAYDTQPQLVSHLEREVLWLRIFMVVSFFVIAGITLFLGLRMTKNLINPLIQMEKHMRQLMLGQWHISDYKVLEDDDFRDLSVTYDYFHRSLRANTEIELKMLEKLTIDPQNREAYAAWKNLVEIKRSRLGMKDAFIVRDDVKTEVLPLRRVS